MVNIVNKAIKSSKVPDDYGRKQRMRRKRVSLRHHNPTSRNWAPATTVLQSVRLSKVGILTTIMWHNIRVKFH
jgi:hypothetical protein